MQTAVYQERVLDRDPCCLISGLRVIERTLSRFEAAHIFPRAHLDEACCSVMVFSCPITDTHPMGR